MSPSRLGEPDADVEGAERADEDHALLGAEPQRARGAAAGGGAELPVLEEAHGDAGVDALRDDAATEPGDPADLGPRVGLAGADEVDDAEQAGDLVRLGAEPQGGLLGHA